MTTPQQTPRPARARRLAGHAVLQVLLVLVVLAVGGAWNYHRNLQAEQDTGAPRPFDGYATADLESLRAAYAKEAAASQKRYAAQDARRKRPSNGDFIDENVREFERVQASSERLRTLQADVAVREARVRELDDELALRRSQASGLALHWKRLVSF